MKLFAVLALVLMVASCSFAYQLRQNRDEMLTYYYSNIDAKVPKSAKLLVGDERINVYLGNDILGIETNGGELAYFEKVPVENPGIVIRVDNDAAEKIAKKQLGVLAAIDSGGIEIEATNWYSGFKVELLKRLYAVAKIDDIVLGKKKSGTSSGEIYNTAYVQRARIVNCLFC